MALTGPDAQDDPSRRRHHPAEPASPWASRRIVVRLDDPARDELEHEGLLPGAVVVVRTRTPLGGPLIVGLGTHPDRALDGRRGRGLDRRDRPMTHCADAAVTPSDADLPVVALVGRPNVGKSTFLARASRRFVETANAPGTTVSLERRRVATAVGRRLARGPARDPRPGRQARGRRPVLDAGPRGRARTRSSWWPTPGISSGTSRSRSPAGISACPWCWRPTWSTRPRSAGSTVDTGRLGTAAERPGARDLRPHGRGRRRGAGRCRPPGEDEAGGAGGRRLAAVHGPGAGLPVGSRAAAARDSRGPRGAAALAGRSGRDGATPGGRARRA